MLRGKGRLTTLTDLSRAELEILQLLADGLDNRQIASVRETAMDTVKNQMSQIMEKLGAKDRTHAVAIAFAKGWVS